MMLEGNAVASGLKWAFLSQSVVLPKLHRGRYGGVAGTMGGECILPM